MQAELKQINVKSVRFIETHGVVLEFRETLARGGWSGVGQTDMPPVHSPTTSAVEQFAPQHLLERALGIEGSSHTPSLRVICEIYCVYVCVNAVSTLAVAVLR